MKSRAAVSNVTKITGPDRARRAHQEPRPRRCATRRRARSAFDRQPEWCRRSRVARCNARGRRMLLAAPVRDGADAGRLIVERLRPRKSSSLANRVRGERGSSRFSSFMNGCCRPLAARSAGPRRYAVNDWPGARSRRAPRACGEAGSRTPEPSARVAAGRRLRTLRSCGWRESGRSPRRGSASPRSPVVAGGGTGARAGRRRAPARPARVNSARSRPYGSNGAGCST